MLIAPKATIRSGSKSVFPDPYDAMGMDLQLEADFLGFLLASQVELKDFCLGILLGMALKVRTPVGLLFILCGLCYSKAGWLEQSLGLRIELELPDLQTGERQKQGQQGDWVRGQEYVVVLEKSLSWRRTTGELRYLPDKKPSVVHWSRF